MFTGGTIWILTHGHVTCQVLDIQSFCRHVPLVELSYVAEARFQTGSPAADNGTHGQAGER